MRRVEVAKLVPGMVTAEDIYTYNNQLIVSKNTMLNDKTITRLEFYSIMSIRIKEGTETPAPPKEQKNTEPWPYSKTIQASAEFHEFKSHFDESINEFKDNVNDIVEKGSPIDVKNVLESTLELFHTSSGDVHFFNMLHNMRQYDDLTYAHSINVALISNVLAGWLHFSPTDIELATLCGLFHDIGKLTIPDQIIKKPAKLTDEEYNIIKTHTVEGYHILLKQNIDDHIKYSALMHHERCDGGGYPLGLTGERIDRFAKIVAIADVYDAMTAARVYRGPLCPFTVIEIFEKEGLQRYEAEYILCFLENVVQTYINNRVKLSNGLEGDIVYINRQLLSKPMVKCGDTFIDLSIERELSIVGIL